MSLPLEAAVYAEYSYATKKVQPGMNVRAFNRVETQLGASIRLDGEMGVITLQPGCYHITASSVVTYHDPDASDQAVVPMHQFPNGGYCMLWQYPMTDSGSAAGALAIGTISNADMIPSLIDTYLVADTEMKIVLAHQAGAAVDGLYLTVYTAGSADHVFARIAIHRIV